MSLLAPYRDEIRRLCLANDELHAKTSALQDEIVRLNASHAEEIARLNASHAEEIARLNASHAEEIARIKAERKCECMSDDAVRQDLASTKEEVKRAKEELAEANNEVEGLEGKLKRYENSTTPGRHGYNEERARIRAEEAQLYAEENGMAITQNHKVGPPEGHKGAKWSMDIQKTEYHETKKCPCCGNTNIKQRKLVSKAIVDFDDESRFLTITLHQGHRMRCDICRKTFKPSFPGVCGTAFGITVLGHILEYVCRKNTDEDTAHYLDKLNGHKCSPNMIWSARKAMADKLAPTLRFIIDELKKAPFLMIDETPYPYKKGKAYVWVVRTDTATLVMPAPGRGALCAPSFLNEIRHMPVVVDGYVVYDGIFAVIQRCWAHILLKAEEAYIRCKDRSFKQVYSDLYHRLCNIHRKAKRIAADTAHLGGADAQTCLDLQTEVECVIAAYGDIAYATHLRNALPHLFTFLLYPGMPSTNNGTERDIRDAVVMQRRFRHKFVSPEGMRVFSILMSFSKTCQKMNLVPSEMLGRIIESPGFDVVSYGLSVLNPRALPAPSPDVAGVEHTDMDNAHNDAPQSHSQEQTATPYDDLPKPDTTAKPTALPYNVLVTILVTVGAVCDQPDSPAIPTTQDTLQQLITPVEPLLCVESPRQHDVLIPPESP